MENYHPFKSQDAKEAYLKLYDDTAKLWPLPSEVKMIDTSYGKTFVRISGPADVPPLVLLHGMGSNSLMWLRNIESLSEDYRTYAIDDIYGNGRSIYTKTIKDSNDFVNWLDELFDVLELGNNINLMGMSYGGWQAGLYALRFPDRLNKVALLAPAATVLPVSSAFGIRAIFSMLPVRYFTKRLMYWVMEDAVKKDEEAMSELVDAMFLASKSFKTRRPPEPTVFDDDEWKSIGVPMLYVVGENEKIYSAEKAVRHLNTVAPQIKTEIIHNAGHDLASVQAEMVNKKVLEFLKQP
ncbi:MULTISPECIES: alpha/beta fold hydrolase [Methanobacterium]|uniref:Alpha/beta hydrolase n=1 Tax=Methanobacterium veterum TaxID=408577 RepID=A0A9E4ZZG4_9EURY|nr:MULTISPECIES: alpha/beta hydrolase [Methanobacterium]MCZ3366813.1 alpha/beta hydrolase [Methanobacterium veterum]MCZ3374040.1 alpha/beta hydrolase [Methanobacterium veterum]